MQKTLLSHKLHWWIADDVATDFKNAMASLIPNLNGDLTHIQRIELAKNYYDVFRYYYPGAALKDLEVGKRPHGLVLDNDFTKLALKICPSQEIYEQEAVKDSGTKFLEKLDAKEIALYIIQYTKHLSEKAHNYNLNKMYSSDDYKRNVIYTSSKEWFGDNSLSKNMPHHLRSLAYRLILEITPESKKNLKMLLKDLNQPDEAILNYTAHFKDIQLFSVPTEGLMQIKYLMMFCARAYYDKQTQQPTLVYDNLREELKYLLNHEPTRVYKPTGDCDTSVMIEAAAVYKQNEAWQKKVEKDALDYIKDYIDSCESPKYMPLPKVGAFTCENFIKKNISILNDTKFEARFLVHRTMRLIMIGLFTFREHQFFLDNAKMVVEVLAFFKRGKSVEESVEPDTRAAQILLSLGFRGSTRGARQTINVSINDIEDIEAKWLHENYDQIKTWLDGLVA